jgi:hypothetical protein
MKFAAGIPALLIVTIVLAGMALWVLRRAQETGRNAIRSVAILLLGWLVAMAAGAITARLLYPRIYHAAPDFLSVAASSLAFAFFVALLIAGLLGRRRSSKSPERLPETPASESSTAASTPQASPQPPVAPPAEAITFKFACPQCGQRLAVTSADVGTTASCPNCATPLTVPSPPAPST